MLKEVIPALALFQPGAEAVVEVFFAGPLPFPARLEVELWRDDSLVATEVRHVAAGPVSPHPLQVAFRLPEGLRGGFGIEARLIGVDGHPLGQASTALDAWEGWWERPRYGFVSEFAPGLGTEGLLWFRRFHLSVAQFYDWMYRHHQFLPPRDEFLDPLGRRLALSTVKRKVQACQAMAVAPLAYGAVYGADPAVRQAHPEWGLYHRDGRTQMLGDFLAIMDPSPGSPWRRLLLQQYELAIRDIGFRGIHMDQYGGPRLAYRHDGSPVRLRRVFPGLIDEAAARVRDFDPQARVIFNNVKAWPLAETAQADQAALYIEVWPPHTRFADLVELIRQARSLSPHRQVILAAYVKPLCGRAEREQANQEQAENAALLTSAIIHAAGGFHLFLGEGGTGLCHAYYPQHARLRPRLLEALRRQYDHITRYSHRLFQGPALWREAPQPGSVWEVRHAAARHRLDLTALSRGEWNVPHALRQGRSDPPPGGVLVHDFWQTVFTEPDPAAARPHQG